MTEIVKPWKLLIALFAVSPPGSSVARAAMLHNPIESVTETLLSFPISLPPRN